MPSEKHPVARFFDLIRQEKSLIYAVYFYAILMGLIQLTLPVGIQAIINFVMAGAFSMSLAVLITFVVAGVFVVGMLQINQMKIIETIRQNIFVKNAYAIADRLPRLDLKKTNDYYLPELVNRFFEVPNLQKGLAKLLLDLPTALIQILFGLILISFYHPVFILFGILLALLLWLMIAVTGKRGLDTSMRASHHKYEVAAWLEELARVTKTFIFFKGSNLYLKKADNTTSDYLSARTQHFSVLLLQYRGLVLFKTIITAAMLIVGSYLMLNQQLNIGQFVAAEIIIITIIAAVEKVISNLDSVYQILVSVDKIAKVIDKPIEETGSIPINPARKVAVSFKDVSFSFDDEKPVLQDISFQIGEGEKVCIEGKQGSGKSTLLRLMTGVYHDFKGSILINNIPIGNYDVASLRHYTGIYLNKQDIFQGTLLENITMGNETVDFEEITVLTQQLGLYDYIVGLKEGLNTELDPSGKGLPSSIVHKILLVRALINKPKLVLLEEPFLHLEEPYKTNLKNLLLDQLQSTVVVVTSNAAFMQDCNQIIHLN